MTTFLPVGWGSCRASCALLTLLLCGAQQPMADSATEWLAQDFDGQPRLVEFADGSTLIADRRARSVTAVARDFRTTRQLGRIGSGPGEFQGVAFICRVAPDSALVVDPVSRKWLIATSRSLRDERSAATWPASALTGSMLGCDYKGGVAFARAIRTSPKVKRLLGPIAGAEFADSVGVVLASRSSPDTIRLPPMRGRIAGGDVVPADLGGIRHFLFDPFSVADQALLFPDGWLALVSVDPYRVRWWNPTGGWIVGPALPHPRERPSNRQKERALREIFGDVGLSISQVPRWTDRIPPFRDTPLMINRDGTLIVERFPLDSVHMEYDIIDRRGQRIRTVRLAGNERLLHVGQQFAYFSRSNEDGLFQVGRRRWL